MAPGQCEGFSLLVYICVFYPATGDDPCNVRVRLRESCRMKPTADWWTVDRGTGPVTYLGYTCLFTSPPCFVLSPNFFVRWVYQVTYPLTFTFVWEHSLFVLQRFVRITFIPFSRSFILCRCLHKFNVTYTVLGRMVWFAVW